jgi:hypothetical protein
MTQNDDVSANDIPDILAGTEGTEARAIANDHDAVVAALGEDPNLLAEVLQPGFVEIVNELAGDAPPTLGSVETVGQAYQDANNETMGEAYQDLLNQQQPAELNPQPLPPSPVEELQQIEQQLEQLEEQINPTQEYSTYEEPQAGTFETMQAEPTFMTDEGPGYSQT